MYDRNPQWFALVISIFVALLYIVNEKGIEYFLSCVSKCREVTSMPVPSVRATKAVKDNSPNGSHFKL